MFIALALATTLSTSVNDCTDHSAYEFGVGEIIRADASGREEGREFPDGTRISIRADYCDQPEYTLSFDAPLDTQNALRLRQLVGQFDRYVSCPISDWEGFDTVITTAAEALDGGTSFDNGGDPIDSDGVNSIYLSLTPSDDRVSGEIRCLRPND